MNQDNAIEVVREFNAPRERVWQAWTNPEQLMQWTGPKDYTCPVYKVDLRVGGKVLCCMQDAEGNRIWSTGTYREVVPMERVVSTDSFSNENGDIINASEYGMEGMPLEMLLTVTFEDTVSGGTKMTLRHEGITSVDMQDGMIEGWNESLDKMAGVV